MTQSIIISPPSAVKRNQILDNSINYHRPPLKMSFKSSSFLYRAASSIMLRRSGQRGVVGSQFTPLVRFLTGSVDSTMKPADETHPQKSHEAVDETSRHATVCGFPFEVKDGGPEKGYLTLIRKRRNEIIEVKVRVCYRPYRVGGELIEDEIYDYDDDVVNESDGDGDGETSRGDEVEYGGDVKIDGEVKSSPGDGDMETSRGDVEIDGEVKSSSEEEEYLKYLLGVDRKVVDFNTWKYEEEEIGYLYMVVKISDADVYKKSQKFFVIALHDKIIIRSMSMSAGAGGHLDEVEEIIKQNIIEPSDLKFVFKNFPRRHT